ncbi:MAG TPA: hypothetical protein VE993_00475 [Stellaceae bacterium]|nr:hypothetical protein [Stellaceae bacterium]
MAKETPGDGAAGRLSFAQRECAVLLLQLLATVAVIGWMPGNFAKLAALLIVWAIGFHRLSSADLALMAAVDAIFIAADRGALRHHVFWFRHPDLMGLPVYEYLMWGFYALHTIRLVGGRCPRFRLFPTLPLTALFAAAFALIGDANLLLLASAAVLAAALLLHHEREDLIYAGYMIAVGALIEYVGTGTGQWSYPGAPYGGVPAWFVTMWGGVGLFTRRLLLPLHTALRLRVSRRRENRARALMSE